MPACSSLPPFPSEQAFLTKKEKKLILFTCREFKLKFVNLNLTAFGVCTIHIFSAYLYKH